MNLLAFLMPHTEISKLRKLPRKKLFIKFLNDQYQKITNPKTSLVQKCLEVHEDYAVRFFIVVVSLLEELGNIDEVYNRFSIGSLLKQSDDIDSERVDDLLSLILAYCTTKTEKYEIFKKQLLSFGMQKGEDNPLFKIISTILEDNEEAEIVKQTFHEDFKNLQNYFSLEKRGIEFKISNAIWIFLTAAINCNQKPTVDLLLDFDSFIILDFNFPPNMKTNEAAERFVEKLLEVGFDIGRCSKSGNCSIPSHWLTPKIYRKFLDSKILRDTNEDFIKLDCSFLLHDHTKKIRITAPENLSCKEIFLEDTKSLEYIVNNQSLQNLITHPTIATYIDLKTKKFKILQLLYFVLVLSIIFAIFAGLIFENYVSVSIAIVLLIVKQVGVKCVLGTFRKDSPLFNELLFLILGITLDRCGIKSSTIYFFLSLKIVLLNVILFISKRTKIDWPVFGSVLAVFTLISFFLKQVFFFFFGHLLPFMIYFFFIASLFATIQKVYLEVLSYSRLKCLPETLLADMGVLTIVLHFFTEDLNPELIPYFIAALITISSMYLISVLRTTLSPFEYIMLKTVAQTFTKAFAAFSIIIISFAVLFHTIFKNKISDEISLEITLKNRTLSVKTENDSLEGFESFDKMPSTFLKTLLMVAGEYSIETNNLNWFELIVVFIFVMVMLVILNLITGLAFDDVQTLRKNARQQNLIKKVEFIIEVKQYYEDFYRSLRKKKNSNWEKIRRNIVRSFIDIYPFLHKIDFVYFNISSKNLAFEINGIHVKTLKTIERYRHFSWLLSPTPKVHEDDYVYCMKKLEMIESND